MKTALQSAIIAALALAGGAAFADDHEPTFDEVDADGDGRIILAEVQAFDPTVTEDGFASYDEDDSGALDETEFDAWKQASAEMDGDEPQ